MPAVPWDDEAVLGLKAVDVDRDEVLFPDVLDVPCGGKGVLGLEAVVDLRGVTLGGVGSWLTVGTF